MRSLFPGILAVCTLTGCAFVDVDVHPPEHPHPPQAASTTGKNREVIVVAPFGDGRLDPRCGMQKNGYGSDTANVNCEIAPGRWLADAFAAELQNAGFKVLRADAAPGPDTIVVRGVVFKMFMEPVDSFFSRSVEADFGVKLEVSTASGLLADRSFYVKGEDESIASTEGVFQSAADSATRKISGRMALAFIELVDHYPQLGAPQASARVSARSR